MKEQVTPPQHEPEHRTSAQQNSGPVFEQSTPDLKPYRLDQTDLTNPQIPLAKRQQAALAIQRQLGNRRLANMIQRHVARLGNWEISTYAQLVAIMRLGIANMQDAMDDVDHEAEEWIQADVWVSNVRTMLPRMQSQGDAELSEAAAAQAQVYYEDYNDLRGNLISWKQRRIRRELNRAQAIVNQRQAQIDALQPQINEQMRNAYLSSSTDAMTQIINFSAMALDVGLGLQALGRDLASAISATYGTSIPESGRYVGMLERFNRVLAAVNLLVSYQDPDAAPNEVGQAMAQINNVTTAFSTAATLFNLAPHIGLYCNLYLGPAVQIATARTQQIIQQYSRQWVQYDLAVGNNPDMSQEPGGGPMFNFLMEVMYAGGPEGVPTLPEAIRDYLLDHREMLDIGAEEGMPTTGWWFWRDLDNARIKSWVFSHRRQLWAMFYGNLEVPPAGTRSRR